MLERGDALLSVGSNNPDLLNGLDPDRVSAMQKTHLENYKPVSMAVSRNAINWCVVAASNPVWAEKIFPALSPKRAETKLWKAIFETARVDQPDLIAAWMEHIQNLVKRSKYLQAKQFTALHYKGPGTDFTLGLPRGHRWIAARMPAENAVEFTANLPRSFLSP